VTHGLAVAVGLVFESLEVSSRAAQREAEIAQLKDALPRRQQIGVATGLALRAVAMTPAMATRHRNRVLRWLVAHQGWYFFPLLLLEGLSLHTDGLKRVLSRGKVEHRWVEIAFLTVRLGGLAALVLAVLPPGKAVAFLAVQLAVFGLYMGSSFAPTTSACRWYPRNSNWTSCAGRC
jgi:hypothetical protein